MATLDSRVFIVTSILNQVLPLKRNSVVRVTQIYIRRVLIVEEELIWILAREMGVASVLSVSNSHLKVPLLIMKL